MKLTLNDISKMVKRVISEIHYGQQLMLPFDGDSEPYNYMQFMEYLELIGEYGTLPPPKQEIFMYEDLAYKTGIGYIDERESDIEDDQAAEICTQQLYQFFERYGEDVFVFDDDEMTYDDFKSYILDEESYPERLDTFTDSLTQRGRILWHEQIKDFGEEIGNSVIDSFITNDKGQIYIERAIDVNKMFERFHNTKYVDSNSPDYNDDLYTTLAKSYPDIGVCWSYINGGGEPYCSNVSNGDTLILKGWVNPEDVDVESTIELDRWGEYEIRLIGGRTVQVDEIVVRYTNQKLPLKGSILLPT